MKKIWLLKSESPNQSYEELLLENEFVVKSIPTLEFEYLCKEEIETALNSPDEFGGIVFTSIRGVQSVSDIFVSLSDSVKEKWKSKLVFVVGQATEKSVKENLKLDSMGSEAGNAKQLGEVIIRNFQPTFKPLLYICGNLKRDDLPNILESQNFKFKLITSYKTVKHKNLEKTISLQLHEAIPDYIVFFSPSGVDFAFPIFSELQLDINTVRIIALGPSTNAALLSNKIDVYGVCREPTPKGLLDILSLGNT